MRKYLKLTFSGDNPTPMIVNIDAVKRFNYNHITGTIIWMDGGFRIKIEYGTNFESEYLKFLDNGESLLVIECGYLGSSYII